MTLLTPLGLLGLLAIVVLIIIYIIKPNYQQKLISSTYVWKLSLKYRKKKIPINKLRNFLIILCQILILTAAAMILAEPVKIQKEKVEETEVIAIIDSSASMRTVIDGESRFTRAINRTTGLVQETLSGNGIVSVILADEKPEFLFERATSESLSIIKDDLGELVKNDNCSYASSDIKSAMTMCEGILEKNNRAKIYLYTDTTYSYIPEGIEVVNVGVKGDEYNKGEWNAGILDAYTVLDDNYYAFYIDLACYGRDEDVILTVNVVGANAENSTDSGMTIPLEETIFCSGDKVKRIIFINEEYISEFEEETSDEVIYFPITETNRVSSYQQVLVSLQTNEPDCYPADDNFKIFNGQKELVRIQYASADPNIFYSAMLQELKKSFADRWEFEFVPVKQGEEPEMEGFDFYIFEHAMPKNVPTDGIVMLVNPLQSVPSGIGVTWGNVYDAQGKNSPLEKDEDHPILNYVRADLLTTSQHVKMTFSADYQSLLTMNGDTVLAVKEDDSSKIIMLGISVHYSNMAINWNFAPLMYNIFDYFLPSTVNKDAFEVNETITLNARGDDLFVSNIEDVFNKELQFSEFPATLVLTAPGTYKLSQTTFTGKYVEEFIFVKSPASESNIWAVEDALESPYKEEENSDFYKDLLIYIAAAMVTILFIEWWLQSRENM